ncbi:hypothetical protein BKA82DRAFT_997858 [Pisolithus tinctorius]|uniref:Uncharacterized protein n=1 Tax=Pisolithus tinctorius Marx 270 TaxID=870435 RepID=A0A0C3KDM3_PISTI|nr:hypothetical protein BKA82DRAFT_997858 [Pisolithus tinctorius]KIO07717.1 hypothetical protein M404DRAFT_997858 [Pisolithus tinctorius Marx 270]
MQIVRSKGFCLSIGCQWVPCQPLGHRVVAVFSILSDVHREKGGENISLSVSTRNPYNRYPTLTKSHKLYAAVDTVLFIAFYL